VPAATISQDGLPRARPQERPTISSWGMGMASRTVTGTPDRSPPTRRSVGLSPPVLDWLTSIGSLVYGTTNFVLTATNGRAGARPAQAIGGWGRRRCHASSDPITSRGPATSLQASTATQGAARSTRGTRSRHPRCGARSARHRREGSGQPASVQVRIPLPRGPSWVPTLSWRLSSLLKAQGGKFVIHIENDPGPLRTLASQSE
jgi:hypothetical protein